MYPAPAGKPPPRDAFVRYGCNLIVSLVNRLSILVITFSAVVTSYGWRSVAFSAAAVSTVDWRVSGCDSDACARAVGAAPITTAIDAQNPSRPLKRMGYLSFPFFGAHARLFRWSGASNVVPWLARVRGCRHSAMPQAFAGASRGRSTAPP